MSISRRHLLQSTACGFGYLALQAICNEQAGAAEGTAMHAPAHPARAKRVIFLCMSGGPAQEPVVDKTQDATIVNVDFDAGYPVGASDIETEILAGYGWF